KCDNCHANPPVSGAPMPLLTYDDLVAHSKVTPSKTYAELAVERMANTLNPMPPMPNPPATAGETAAPSAWAAHGAPNGRCDGSAGVNRSDMPPMCSSMTTWTMGNADSNQMLPGITCVACHNNPPEGGLPPPPLIIGGTVYRTGHEPDNCFGGPEDPIDNAIV